MRVAIVRPIPRFSFSMDVYADSLIKGLKKNYPEWDIQILHPTLNQDKAKGGFWKKGVEKYYSRYWSFPRRLKQINADIFHVVDHSDGHLLYWLQVLNQPSVVTCHDLINLVQPDTFRGRARIASVSMASWKFAVRGMKTADHVITVSSHTAQDVSTHLNIAQEKITVIPNAVESVFHPLAHDVVKSFRERHNVSDQTFCLLNVGSNNLRKNVITVLKSVAVLKDEGVDVCLWKTGADFTPEQKKFIAARNMDSCILYLGKPEQADLIKFYNAADALVAPSLYEGFGLTALESMSCGTPVITSNVTSIPEVVGDAAILVEPLDVDAIVESIVRLRSQLSNRNKLIHQGLERAKTFTWERTAEQVAEVYKKVVIQTRGLL